MARVGGTERTPVGGAGVHAVEPVALPADRGARRAAGDPPWRRWRRRSTARGRLYRITVRRAGPPPYRRRGSGRPYRRLTACDRRAARAVWNLRPPVDDDLLRDLADKPGRARCRSRRLPYGPRDLAVQAGRAQAEGAGAHREAWVSATGSSRAGRVDPRPVTVRGKQWPWPHPRSTYGDGVPGGTVGDRGAALRQALAARGRRRRCSGGRGRRARARAAGHRRSVALRAPDPYDVPPYVGDAESTGRLGLPEIPQLESTVALLTGTTRIRAFVGSADAWRADELTPTGEHGVYRARAVGVPVGLRGRPAHPGARHRRGPFAARVGPPAARPRARLLALAGNDPVSALPSRRVAGRDAAGLRVTPDRSPTTVGSVDIWADRRRRCRCASRSRAAPGRPAHDRAAAR